MRGAGLPMMRAKPGTMAAGAASPAPDRYAQGDEVLADDGAELTGGRLTGRAVWVLLAVALVPLVVAAARALVDGWVPVGDSALIAIRAGDVLGGSDLPQLGMWASTSWQVGFDLNHPGPLLYDALALPTTLFGNAAGSVVGAVAVSAVAVVGIVVVARRCGGPLVAAVAAAVAATLCWSMGSAVLVEPWHASTLLLPFLLLVLLVWALACGDIACLPWAALVASFVVQTNLSYGIFVPVLAVWGLVGLVLARRRDGAAGRSALGRRRVVATGAATAAVLVLCWLAPIVEEVAGEGEGNLSRLARAAGGSGATLDPMRALRAVAAVVALPPWWGRPSYHRAFRFGAFGNPLPPAAPSVVALVALAGVLAWCWRTARRRRDAVSAAAVSTAGVFLLAALVTATVPKLVLVAYQVRWLWPLGAFVTFTIATTLVRRFAGAAGGAGPGHGPGTAAGGTAGHRPAAPAHPPAGGRTRLVLGACAAVTVLVAVANLPTSNQGTPAPAATLPVARALTAAVRDADLTGPLLVKCSEGVFDPYCEAVMAGLERDGIRVLVDDSIGVRQLGTGRRGDAGDAAGTVTVLTGELAAFGPPGARQLTLHDGVDADELTDLEGLRDRIAAALAAGEVKLDDRGRRVAARGDLPSVSLGPEGEATVDGEAAVGLRPFLFGEHRRDLVAMVAEDLLAADDRWHAVLDRYLELQRAQDEETSAVYLTPGRS